MSEKVVIIGGGIVGLCCGFFARSEGLDVTIVDPDVAENRASFGNAGVLAVCEQFPIAKPDLLFKLPQMLLHRDSPLSIRWKYLPKALPWLMRFAIASTENHVRRSTESLHQIMTGALPAHLELSAAASALDLLARSGWIKAWERAPNQAPSAEREVLSGLGIRTCDLSLDELHDLAPGFAGIFEAATLFSDCYRVTNPGRYVSNIRDACSAAGIRFVRGKVAGFEFKQGKMSGVFTDAQPSTIEADKFVIAGGAWSRQLAATLGDEVPLDTERGYHLMLDLGESVVLRAPLLWQDRSVVLSPMEDGLRMTSSVEFAGLNAPPNYRNIERTLTAIKKRAPALSSAKVASRWLGFRPSVPDSVPVIGRSRKHENCFLAFGHGHLGLTLGPVTGKLIAKQLARQIVDMDMTPYSPSRFSR